MDNTLPFGTSKPEPKTEEDYEKAIDQILAELGRMKTEMDERQRRIEYLRAENESLLASMNW
jgi:hypothetical protein